MFICFQPIKKCRVKVDSKEKYAHTTFYSNDMYEPVLKVPFNFSNIQLSAKNNNNA